MYSHLSLFRDRVHVYLLGNWYKKRYAGIWVVLGSEDLGILQIGGVRDVAKVHTLQV